MTRIRLALALAVAAAVAAGLLLGGLFRDSRGAVPAPPPEAAAAALQNELATADTASLVRSLQATLRRNPTDVHAYDLLGLAYQQLARETGDPAYYTKSEGVLRRALALSPNDLLATSGFGSLALSRHRFREALALGRRARAISPTTARSYGVIGDALVELGRYREAFAAFDTMARLRPGLAAYARVSYARELRGDFDGAVAAMRLAVDAAADEPEALAWTHVQLGKLYWGRGRLAVAARQYRTALFTYPGYVYALDALAQVEAARGRYRRAMALERRALALARLAYRERPSIDGDDVLAWALARTGHCGEALHFSKRALRLGTRDAVKEFHRGMIERCLGHDMQARLSLRRALDLNPHFSLLWAPVARRYAV